LQYKNEHFFSTQNSITLNDVSNDLMESWIQHAPRVGFKLVYFETKLS